MCHHPGCKTRASYNINGESKGLYCATHKQDGMIDIKNKIARTPLNPFETFMDDPLRLLRTIRFANRFNLKILPEIIKASQDPLIKVR